MRKSFLMLAVFLVIVSAYSAAAYANDSSAGLVADSYTKDSITLSWNDVHNGVYSIYMNSEGSNEYELYLQTGESECTVSNLEAGRVYSFRLYYGESCEEISAAALPERVRTVTAENIFSKKMKLTWNCTGRCSGYEVQYSLSREFKDYRKTDTSSKTAVLTRLKYDCRYYIRVRAYTEAGGVRYFGSWSPVKSFKYHAWYKKAGRTYVDGHLIVNKTFSLPSSYAPGITNNTKAAWKAMKKAAAADGINLYISSGYRSYGTQKSLYGSYKSMYGRSTADVFSARPGHSEHQSGLALDLNIVKDWFAGTKEAKWLSRNCWKYGFVIRYPEGKSYNTGYKYEPWHVRYVGKTLAEKLYNGGKWLAMEEYYGITSRYR